MNKKQLKTVIREFLSEDKGSPVIGDKYENIFLEKRQEYINAMLKNKKSLVKRYGKDAEKVLTGRAVKDAKKYIENMKKQDIKELVRKSLMQEESSFINDPFVNKAAKFLGMSADEIKNSMVLLKKEEIPSTIPYSIGVYKIKSPKGLIYFHHAPMSDSIHMYNEAGKRILENLKENEEENPKDTITMDVPLFIRMLEYAREDANADVDLHDVTEKAIGLSGEDKVLTMADYEFIVGESESLDEDLDLGHQDDEPHMIKGELYQIGKYAMELYKMVDGFEDKGEVDFPAWWQSKITTAKNMISGAKHYLEFETKEPTIDTIVRVASDEEVIDEKTLTPAEKKKKEEIVKVMKKDFKGPKPVMYAIATKKAKELAEERFKKGTDIGKKGPGFEKITKKAGKAYGSEEAGKRVAGAVLQKILAKKLKENSSLDKDKEAAWEKFQKDRYVTKFTINDARKVFEKEWEAKKSK